MLENLSMLFIFVNNLIILYYCTYRVQKLSIVTYIQTRLRLPYAKPVVTMNYNTYLASTSNGARSRILLNKKLSEQVKRIESKILIISCAPVAI